MDNYLGGVQRSGLFVYFVLTLAITTSALAEENCRVSDPTGTPLNIRTNPDGQIIGNLNNGIVVSVLSTAVSKTNKKWVQVARDGVLLGWVFRDYVDCSLSFRKNGPG